MREWIPFDGNQRPVPADTRVKVRLRNGEEMKRFARARSRWWGRDHRMPEYEIVAYLVEDGA